MAISLGCNVYIAHVRSKRNIADPPSRKAPEVAAEILQQVGVKRQRITYDPSPKLPSLEQWEEPAQVWTRPGQALRIPSLNTGGADPHR